MISTRLNNLVAIVTVAKNEVNIISLAAILGGQAQAEAIGFNIQKQQNSRFSLYFEIIGLIALCFQII